MVTATGAPGDEYDKDLSMYRVANADAVQADPDHLIFLRHLHRTGRLADDTTLGPDEWVRDGEDAQL